MSTDRKPPDVPASHPTQRYFLPGPGYGGMSIYGKRTYAPVQQVRVFRDALDDCVEMSIRSGDWGETNTYLDALELRIIAAALLDAAHDLEAHPAAALRAQASAGLVDPVASDARCRPQVVDPDTEAFAAGEQQVSTR